MKRNVFCLLLVWMVIASPAWAQDGKVTLSFVPPPLENATYSVGIYDAKGRLVRRLKSYAPESAFTVGLNGLITAWDGKDDGLQPVPPGRYSARGYAVGALKVEGIGILGNDWASDDATLRVRRVEALALVPQDEGLAVVARTGEHRWELLRLAGADSALVWRAPVDFFAAKAVSDGSVHNIGLEAGDDGLTVTAYSQRLTFQLADGHRLTPKSPHANDARADPLLANVSPGKDGTVWKVEEGVLAQYSAQGERLRSLAPKEGEPVPQAVAASAKSDRLYLLEAAGDWQRVRGLSWVETKEESGKPVSTWKTFFERNIHKTSPVAAEGSSSTEISLVENPLVPGKPQKAKVRAEVDDKGSYLATADGLRLRRISESPDLSAVMLQKTKTPGRLVFFQTDGAAWDEFSIEGAKNMMEFDAGGLEMTAEGEKTHAEKPAEPPDL